MSIPDPAALAAAIRAATGAGIPVISINSGADAYRELGVLAHVGQTEYEAGFAGGERLAAAGVRTAGALRTDPTIDGLLALGPAGADPALAVLRSTARAGDVSFGTFDLTPRVLEAVRDGEMLFAIDPLQPSAD